MNKKNDTFKRFSLVTTICALLSFLFLSGRSRSIFFGNSSYQSWLVDQSNFFYLLLLPALSFILVMYMKRKNHRLATEVDLEHDMQRRKIILSKYMLYTYFCMLFVILTGIILVRKMGAIPMSEMWPYMLLMTVLYLMNDVFFKYNRLYSSVERLFHLSTFVGLGTGAILSLIFQYQMIFDI